MQDFNELNITDSVIERFGATPSPRLKQLVCRLTAHLHDYVREVEPSFEEWLYAVQFLTRTGQLCGGGRQEFVLLSDVLGISMLVDAVNHRRPDATTETTVLGPFYVEGAPLLEDGADMSPGMPGEPLYIEGRVTASDGTPLEGARVDLWHCDQDGFYDVQHADLAASTGRGRLRAGAHGKFRIRTTMPVPYPIPYDGPVGELLTTTKRHPWRPAHVHFMIAHPGYETLVTHLFASDSEYLDSDAVFGVKASLIRDYVRHEHGPMPDGTEVAGAWRHLAFEFALKPQG
jgi:hydroxyquinol 1,2-dioxygenase